jgi:hypothetical protein
VRVYVQINALDTLEEPQSHSLIYRKLYAFAFRCKALAHHIDGFPVRIHQNRIAPMRKTARPKCPATGEEICTQRSGGTVHGNDSVDN